MRSFGGTSPAALSKATFAASRAAKMFARGSVPIVTRLSGSLTGPTTTSTTAGLSDGTATTGFASPILGNSITAYAFAPAAVFGVPDADGPVVGLWGDSITAGVGNGDHNDLYSSWAEEGLAGQLAAINLSRHNEN